MTRVLEQLFSFRGRSRRAEFWIYSSVVFFGAILAAAVIAALVGVDLADPRDPRTTWIEAAAVVLFAWPNFAVCAKRLHDRNLSGWWVLLGFLPVIGNAWLLLNLGVLRGSDGENRYGPDPVRPQLTLIHREPAVA